MVCHMLWILTSEEFDELALDGTIIPRGLWKIAMVLSHWLREEFYEPQLGVVHYTSKMLSYLLSMHKYCMYHIDKFDTWQYLWISIY